MEININEMRRIVEIWLSNTEKGDNSTKEYLTKIYENYKNTTYLVVVYESGNGDLFSGTKNLLLQNRDVSPIN